ncbi:MAG: vanadium-dependent haloperoxidase [Pseudolabrys sp.]
MKSTIKNWWCKLLLAGAMAAVFIPPPARADVIIDWNARSDEIAAQKQVRPVNHSRGTAMLHVAMFEAVNAIEGRYLPYKLTLTADRTASKEAAAASAGHDILLALYPDQQSTLDATLATMLAAVVDGEPKAKGIELGKKAAADLIVLRAKDGIDAQESYRPHTTPGVYVPTVIPLFSTAAAVTPWVMTSGSQFRPAPPPALTSETWTADLNEIRELGRIDSTKRTAEQTTIGRFWFVTGPRSYNPIVRQVAIAKDMDIVDCARLFALTSMAGNDAYIAVFDAKYTYNLWRPLTAIRNADQTNNSATPRDGSWLPLGDTPMHPEYPCAHCINSAAVAAVLQGVAGNEIGEISMTSPTAPGVIRKWVRLQDYSDEVSLARIYAGFHYRFSTIVGKEMGKKIGELAVATQMRRAETAAAQPR